MRLHEEEHHEHNRHAAEDEREDNLTEFAPRQNGATLTGPLYFKLDDETTHDETNGGQEEEDVPHEYMTP